MIGSTGWGARASWFGSSLGFHWFYNLGSGCNFSLTQFPHLSIPISWWRLDEIIHTCLWKYSHYYYADSKKNKVDMYVQYVLTRRRCLSYQLVRKTWAGGQQVQQYEGREGNLMHVADKRLKNTSAFWAHCKSWCTEHLEKVVKTNMNTVSSDNETLKKHTPFGSVHVSCSPNKSVLSKQNYFGSIQSSSS